MLGAESLQCNAQFYGSIPVNGDKLVMLQFDDIAVLLRNNIGYMAQLPRTVGQKHRYRKNPVT